MEKKFATKIKNSLLGYIYTRGTLLVKKIIKKKTHRDFRLRLFKIQLGTTT